MNDPEEGDYSLAPGSPATGYGCRTFDGDGDSGRSSGPNRPAPRIFGSVDKGNEITVSGPITTDTVWKADKVNVVGDVTVENGVPLTIDPGVLVEFHDYYRLSVPGRLLALGTPTERILFTTDEPNLFTVDASHTGCWNGIRFHDTPETNGTSILEYCILEYSKATQSGGSDSVYPYGGGAVSLFPFSKLAIRKCIFQNNVAGNGGALFLYQNACPRIIGNLFTDNHALENASVAYCAYSYPEFTNNTAVNNPIHNLENPYIDSCAVLSFLAKPKFTNNIFQRNDPEYVYLHCQLLENKGYYTHFNNIDDYGKGGLNIDADPLFVKDPDDLRLQDQSPCINRGTNDGAPLEDLDGASRPGMGTVDMGAYEFAGVHRLAADVFSLSEATGGSVHFTLNGGAGNASRSYLLLGGASETIPGMPLPGGKATLPVNWDFFTSIVIDALNSPLFNGFLGTLNGSGTGTATLFLPPVPGAADITLHFAYTLYPYNFVSNPVEMAIEE